ncbi:hypothetical protein QBC41DRAFT_393097 [Cercophora samala]|uniref:Uncharacterized protein n=1 Tax=Cercophora samala TaxID=330535 RepID=A0AA39ZMG5_9PEZI|nr:hypothetical protein QBC41DRAFT_393097 [Cercophora samala]
MMIAAGELDRLSFQADDAEKSKRMGEREGAATHSESVLGSEVLSTGSERLSPGSATNNIGSVPPNTPNTPVTPNTALGSGTPASPTPGGGEDRGGLSRSILSLSGANGDFVPFPPANTPAFGRSGSASPVAGAATPTSRSSSGGGVLGTSPGKQRAAGPSRLSEVHNFEEVVRRLSRSDSPSTPRGQQQQEKEPVYRLESFPEFPDRGETSSAYTSGESTPRHRPAAHYFVAGGLSSGGVSGLRLRGHGDCEELEGRRVEGKGGDTHAVDCAPDRWRPEDGEPGEGEVFCPRGSTGSRLSFGTSEERRRSWLDIARRATKGRWDHELEECGGLTADGEEGEEVVTKRKHTIADIVELLRLGKGASKGE